jgi:glyoxylase I family protein
MRVVGLTFVGSRTTRRAEMTAFARDVLGLAAGPTHGMDADVFPLPDGSTFVVADAEVDGEGDRTIGLLVEDLDEAVAELRAAGVEMDSEISANQRQRYVHFRPPDGRLYELVENIRAEHRGIG